MNGRSNSAMISRVGSHVQRRFKLARRPGSFASIHGRGDNVTGCTPITSQISRSAKFNCSPERRPDAVDQRAHRALQSRSGVADCRPNQRRNDAAAVAMDHRRRATDEIPEVVRQVGVIPGRIASSLKFAS